MYNVKELAQKLEVRKRIQSQNRIVVCVFETESCYVGRLTFLLPWPPECQDYKNEPSCPALYLVDEEYMIKFEQELKNCKEPTAFSVCVWGGSLSIHVNMQFSKDRSPNFQILFFLVLEIKSRALAMLMWSTTALHTQRSFQILNLKTQNSLGEATVAVIKSQILAQNLHNRIQYTLLSNS